MVRVYQYQYYSIIVNIRLHRLNTEEKLEAFDLIDMQTAFYCLGIGLMGCCLVFLMEIIFEHHQQFHGVRRIFIRRSQRFVQ